MDVIFKKYFFIAELVSIALVAFFVAAIGNTILESKLLAMPDIPKIDPKTASATASSQAPAINVEDIKKANIFKTQHEASIKVDMVNVKDPSLESLEPTFAKINYVLVGTIVSDNPAWSYTLMIDNSTHSTDLYGINSVVADSYKITQITRKRVTFNHAGRIEYLDLDEDPNKRPVAVASKPPDPGAAGDGVKEVGPGKYVVAQSELDGVLTNLNQVAMQARIVPNMVGGKANGFKFFSIKPGSIYSKIGLQNEDVVTKINGFEINSPDKALEIYQKLRDVKNLSIEIQRKGNPMTFDYAIR